MNSNFFHGVQDTRNHWSEDPPEGLALSTFHGAITFGDGQIARTCGAEWVDPGQGDSPFSGYLVAVLPDGSRCHQEYQGHATGKARDGATIGVGSWRFLSGTGAFAGLAGGGVLEFRFHDGHWRGVFSASD